MSTRETPERPHQRRRRLTVATVATAVVLAGGGGAYWASNAAGPADGVAAGSDSPKSPPPLVLDTVGLSESGDAPARGIAPGEPNPSGTVYEAEGELPEGPGSAAVHRPDGDLTRAEVEAIAKALEVPGTPEQSDGRWRVGGPKDGSGPLLTVDDSRGGASWSYVRHRPTGDDLCGKPKDGGSRTLPAPCPGGVPGSGGGHGDQGGPVSAQEAKKAVEPTLEALHLEDATLDASSAHGSLRVVNAQPQAGGLPVQDWVSSFTVNPTGQLVRGHGHLGDLVKGAEYPVMTAEQTLKALNKHRGAPQPEAPSCDAGPPAEPKQGDARTEGYPKADDLMTCAPSGTEGEAGAAENTATVTDATFGLAAEYSEGKPVLVPAWIYEIRQQGGEGTYEVAYPAVEPEFLRTPDENAGGTGGGDTPASPGGESRALVSYTVDGRELTVTFWGGVCHEYRATAKPENGKVAVTVEPKNPDPKQPCIMIAKKQQVKVQLDKPLDGREVVAAQSGKELPKKK